MNDGEPDGREEPLPATPFIHRHPWIIVVAVFLFLILAWTVLIVIASKNRPERVPLDHRNEQVEP